MTGIYIFFSLLTTVAFIYLLYHYFTVSFIKRKQTNDYTSEVELLSDNIQNNIINIESNPNHNEQQDVISTQKQPTVKILINNIHKRHDRNIDVNRKFNYLPGTKIGLTQMKIMNKIYKQNKHSNINSLLNKQKKKNNISNYVKKYGFYKTSLVTIYEQLQY